MSYGEADSHPSGFEQGNIGYSGAPLWKIKQQTQQHQAMVQAAQEAALEEQKRLEELKKAQVEQQKGDKIFADGVMVKGTKGAQMVKQILVKDLRKAASAMRMKLPEHGIFNDGGGLRALFALFDGHGGEGLGPKSAEHCCRHLLGNILRNLLSLPVEHCTATFVKAALLKTFEDLESELLMAQVPDRCHASLILVVGEWLFSAVLGHCGAVYCQGPVGKSTGPDEMTQLRTGASALQVGFGTLGTPEVKGVQVRSHERRCCFVLSGVPVAGAVASSEIQELTSAFGGRPRAVAGEVTARTVAKLCGNQTLPKEADGTVLFGADCACIAGIFKPNDGTDGPPAAKKAKTEQKTDNVRIRHILIRYKGARAIAGAKDNKPITRSREDAEVVLRNALLDLQKDGYHGGDKMWAAKATPRIINITRELSECKSSQRGGSMCGDLGWLAQRDLQNMGMTEGKDGFWEAILQLKVAEWSDVLHSDQGCHLVMRIA
eukprot:TRINITY_DN74202_c0_g1_i1.p1 TRINITY_DN74202_c0_g1~~TRINITY_DN74202_c0_g1_i1.p1  ORF type:complete len:490 (-),score=135.90 TRINITY_DN74202_c0_g1_i1:81-1550(-)